MKTVLDSDNSLFIGYWEIVLDEDTFDLHVYVKGEEIAVVATLPEAYEVIAKLITNA